MLQRLTSGKEPTRILCCGHSLGAAVALLSKQQSSHAELYSLCEVFSASFQEPYVRTSYRHSARHAQTYIDREVPAAW